MHSGRTYHSDLFNMEDKLYLILKELQDLKLRVEVLENKNKSSRDDTRARREENTNRHRDVEDDIIRRIKIDPPIFDGILDPEIFIDWMSDLGYYFDWYRLRKV